MQSSTARLLGLPTEPEPLRDAFLRWQCRVRQMMMRDDGSRAGQLASRFASSRSGALLDRMRRNFRNEINSGVPARDVFSPTRAETIAMAYE